MDWIHNLSVNIDQEQEVDVNDDLVSELAFYTQANLHQKSIVSGIYIYMHMLHIYALHIYAAVAYIFSSCIYM